MLYAIDRMQLTLVYTGGSLHKQLGLWGEVHAHMQLINYYQHVASREPPYEGASLLLQRRTHR